MYLMRLSFVLLCAAALTFSLSSPAQRPEVKPAQKVEKADPPKKKYPRGYKPAAPEVQAQLHAAAKHRLGAHVARLPKTTAPQFDCRTAFGNVLPCDDQGQCGDCFGVSAADGCSMALIKAGQLPLDGTKGRLSSQYGLDYPRVFQGGCNGGDEAQVIDFIKTNGFPLTSDYGDYTASPGRPKDISGMKLYKIADWGYCTPDQANGIASTQDMKNCMVQYGPLSVAFDAQDCDNYNWPNTMTGRGTSVDHAVLCIGWDDTHDNGDGTKGAFLGFNQWGESWGNKGVFWIKYGADSWGTEAIWITATAVPPPPGPGPGPGPTPPPGPPGANPVVSATLTFKDGTTQTLLGAGSIAITPQTTLGEILAAMSSGKQPCATREEIEALRKLLDELQQKEKKQ
jgi:C1A family cysteine protease